MNTTTNQFLPVKPVPPPTVEQTCIGWTVGDGSGHDGYNSADYFDHKGNYLGPDEHGIEPIFERSTLATQLTWALTDLAKCKARLHKQEGCFAEALMFLQLGEIERVKQLLIQGWASL